MLKFYSAFIYPAINVVSLKCCFYLHLLIFSSWPMHIMWGLLLLFSSTSLLIKCNNIQILTTLQLTLLWILFYMQSHSSLVVTCFVYRCHFLNKGVISYISQGEKKSKIIQTLLTSTGLIRLKSVPTACS